MTEVEKPHNPNDLAPPLAPSDLQLTIDTETPGLDKALSSPMSDSGVGSSEGSTPTTETVAPPNGTAGEKNGGPAITAVTVVPPPGGASATVPKNGIVLNGPDEIIPSETLVTWLRDQAVKLRMSDSGPLSEKPLSIPTVFSNTVRRLPNHTALAVKRDGIWQKWTYARYYEEVKQAAKSLIKLGLEPYHGVGIIGFNSPEWFITDLAAIHACGFATGIYTTNTPEACHYVADSCEANVIVVENNQQLQKILKVWDRLPHLKAVVQYTGELAEKRPNVYTWREFMDLGRKVDDRLLQERIKMLAPNKCCTLIYTSGTTGNPKGVMLCHDNFIWTAIQCGRMGKLKFGQEVLISYLPLSHVAAQLLDIYFPMVFGGSTYFAQPDALKGSLNQTLKEVRPTAFFGVPRVWEKIAEKVQAVGRQATGIKKKMAEWAKDIGFRGNMSLQNGGSTPFGWTLANALIFKRIRQVLGLDRCKFCMTGAAPIMKETLDYFLSLNIPLMEVYGMSESSGPHTISFPDVYKTTSVGVEFPGAATKFANADPDGNGEICMGGRHIFMGYLGMEEKTRESVDEEGWLHSGDVGRKDQQGFLYITGRIKELIITAGGENIPPVMIEDQVKEELPVISNALLVGDKRKFLTMLLTLKTDVDPDTMEPQDTLNDVALRWCASVGSSAKTLPDILDNKDEKVLKAIQEGVDRANSKSVSRAQKIQKWSILPRDFSIPGGELGPTLKVRRPIIHKMYANTIDAFYGES